jgi:signal transduction histidine kinase
MSLRDNALLVSLTVRKPQMTMKDDKATRDAEDANNAHNAGHYRKDLYPKNLIQPINTVESSARAYIDRVTYMWNRGQFLLPTANFMEFAPRIAQYQLEFEQAVTAFLNNWNNVMYQAKNNHGDLFDSSVYPDIDELREGFKMRVTYAPVPAANDIRVTMDDNALAMLRAQVEEEITENMTSVLREPLERLRKTIARLNEATGKEDRVSVDKRGIEIVKPPIFRDSIVENIHEEINMLLTIADALPAQTVTFAQNLSQKLPTPQALRDDPGKREEAHVNTKHLLAAIDSLLED